LRTAANQVAGGIEYPRAINSTGFARQPQQAGSGPLQRKTWRTCGNRNPANPAAAGDTKSVRRRFFTLAGNSQGFDPFQRDDSTSARK
jgi:hypothetical protein